jgi:hypothetical protein
MLMPAFNSDLPINLSIYVRLQLPCYTRGHREQEGKATAHRQGTVRTGEPGAINRMRRSVCA